MSLDITILLFRIGIIVLLFIFLGQALLLIRRDLRRAGALHQERGGRLRVMESGASNLSKGDIISLAGINSFGRSPGNSLQVMDDSVSGDHLILSYDGATWRLEDLGSTNGTYVNGQRVVGTADVSFGDFILLGRTKLKLERPGVD